MTPEVYTVAEDTPVAELAETLVEEHVHRLLVLREEKVVGIVSTSDLLGLLIEEED
jgi:CBS domain-containing protein